MFSNTIYVIRDENGVYVGHNNYNFGNYLWGAAANALGVSLKVARVGAHINNLMNDPDNQNIPWYKPFNRKLDSSDDQYSIKLGWKWHENGASSKISK